MLAKIIARAVKHRVVTIGATIVMMLLGIVAFVRLPIDAVPDITTNQVQILTNAPSLSSLEVEQLVTFPIELSVKSLPDVVEMRSLSRAGLSVITVVFEEGVDIYFARQLILERLREVEGELPPDVERPGLSPVSTGLSEFFRYTVKDTSGRYTPMQLRTIQDWIVRRQLIGADGLAEVNSLGGELKQYHVLVDPDAAYEYGLSLRDIYEKVSDVSGNAGGAYVEKGQEHYAVRSVGLASNEEDIASSVIKTTDDGTPVLVSDVAEVRTNPALRFGTASQDGQGEVVVGIVMALKGANARTTVNIVKDRLESIRKQLPEGVIVEPYYDREELVMRTIRTVATNLIEGALLVIGMLLILLVSLRAGIIVASVIPLSMCFAAIMMYLSGTSGNLMSLGAIDFGLVVDGTLIIVENILRRIQNLTKSTSSEGPAGNAGDGGMENSAASHGGTTGSIRQLVFDGAIEVQKAAQYGYMIIIVVYLPIITLQGIEGKLFRPMALTVTFALVGAFLLSVTYVPAITSFLFKPGMKIKESIVIRWLRKAYRPSLDWALRHRLAVTSGAVVLIAGAWIGFANLGGEFVPELDEGDIAMHLIRLPSVSLTESQRMATEVEKDLMEFPEVRTVVTHTGRAEVSTDPMGFELADVFVMLKPESEWTSGRSKVELIADMKERLDRYKGIGTQFQQPIAMRTNELISGARGDVVAKVYGESFDKLVPISDSVAAIMASVRGGVDVTREQLGAVEQYIVSPDRPALARYGLTAEDINATVETSLAGATAGRVYEGERYFDIVVRMDEARAGDLATLKNTPVMAGTGAVIPLDEVADVRLGKGPVQVSREEGSRFTGVQANVRGRDVESYVEEVQNRIASEIDMPTGYRIEYGGKFQNLIEARGRLAIVVPIALFLILGLLYQTFGSFRDGILIFLCIPMAVVGGVASLYIRGLPFSISAGVGFIALFGIAVLNGIVMVSAIRKHMSDGEERMEAVKNGAHERLRPVITTASLAAFGFLPMAFSTSAGAEVQRPLATVVIGGLVSATLLTLFVLPAIYSRFGRPESADDVIIESGPTGGAASKGLAIGLLLFLPFVGMSPLNAQTTLDRPTFVQRVLERHPEVGHTEEKGRERLLSAESMNELDPTRLYFETENRGPNADAFEPEYTFGITQRFDFPTAYGARGNVADEIEHANRQHRGATRRRLELLAVGAWYEALRARIGMDVIDSSLGHARALKRIADARHQAGEIGILDVHRANLAVGEAVGDSLAAAVRYDRALAAIRRLGGFERAEAFEISSEGIVSPTPVQIDSIADRIVRAAPSVKEAEAEIRVAESRRGAISSGRLPGLQLTFVSQTKNGVSGLLGGRVGIDVALSRWLGDPATEAAEASVSGARYRLAEVRLDVGLTADSIARELQSDVRLIEQYESSIVPTAQQAFDASVTAYRAGEIGFPNVIPMHERLIEIELQYRALQLELERTLTYIEILTTPHMR